MSNRVFDIRLDGVPYPETLYIDANVAIKIFESNGRDAGADYERYIVEAVQHGTLLIYSQVVLAEVKRWVHKSVHKTAADDMKISATKKKPAWKVLEDKQLPQVGQAAVGMWEAVKKSIVTPNSIEAYMPGTNELDVSSNTLIARYGLGVGDAEHVAIMNYNETNSVLTDDGGFRAVPGLNVFSRSYTALANGTSSTNTLLPFSPLI